MEAELVRREKNAAEPDMNYKTPFTKEEHMEQRRQEHPGDIICTSTYKSQIRNNNILKQPKKNLDIHKNMQ